MRPAEARRQVRSTRGGLRCYSRELPAAERRGNNTAEVSRAEVIVAHDQGRRTEPGQPPRLLDGDAALNALMVICVVTLPRPAAVDR